MLRPHPYSLQSDTVLARVRLEMSGDGGPKGQVVFAAPSGTWTTRKSKRSSGLRCGALDSMHVIGLA